MELKPYLPEYNDSWALIIGINDYQNVPPLSYAKNDASSVKKILTEKFDFPKKNIDVLYDGDATKDKIIKSYYKYINDFTDPDDRILVFFAGHGYTQVGRRGNIGYLIPVDGTPDSLESLIAWDEFTRNSELINAKHMLFIMDACYSGLAITRTVPPGSMRFLKDMLQRFTRQVLTAGKADETVADSGGPLPDHSV